MSQVIRWGAMVVCVGLSIALLVLAPLSHAQDKKPAPEIKGFMKKVSQPNCGGAAKLLKKGPASDDDWSALEKNANNLNQLSKDLMAENRCLSGDWAKACATLKDCSAKLAEAAKGKKVDDARTALKGVIGACGVCHTAHRKKA